MYMTTSPVQEEYLIDQILWWTYYDCAKISSQDRCCSRKRGWMWCRHARMLSNCITISRKWSRIALRHLWGRYAGLTQLWRSIRYRAPTNVITMEQQKCLEFYSSFVRRLCLREENDFSFSSVAILEAAVQLENRSLFPIIEKLELGAAWTRHRMCIALLPHLITNQTRSVKLEFQGREQSPDTLFRYFDMIARRTNRLKSLQVLLALSEEDQQSVRQTLQGQRVCDLSHSLDIFRRLTSLTKLSLYPALCSIDILDVIGDLPHLATLKLIDIESDTAAVSFPSSLKNPRRRYGKFRNIKELWIQTTLWSMDVFFGLFFSDATLSSLEIINIELRDNPTSTRDFEVLARAGRNLKDLTLTVTGNPQTQLDIALLSGIGLCPLLESLTILHPKFLTLDKDFDLSHCWPQLKRLELDRYSGILGLGLSPDELTQYDGPGLSYSSLGQLAKCLPNLDQLKICMIIGPTYDLPGIESEDFQPFQNLSRLEFSNSFFNWKVNGYLPTAIGYITALIPLNCCPYPHPGNFRLQLAGILAGDLAVWKRFQAEWDGYIEDMASHFRVAVGGKRTQVALMRRLGQIIDGTSDSDLVAQE